MYTFKTIKYIYIKLKYEVVILNVSPLLSFQLFNL